MPYIDRDLLNLKIKRANMTNDSVAKELGVDRSTLYRHLREGSLTVAEVHDLGKLLKLTAEDIYEIFFAHAVA